MQGANSASATPKTVLSVKALTWLRDSHGLFDYENFQLAKSSVNVSSGCNLIRCGNDIRTLTFPALGDYETIGNIKVIEGNLLLYI